jgi:hypothetical protein
MRKFLLFCLIVLVLGLAHYFYENSTLAWTTYTNTDYGLKMNYPSNWSLLVAAQNATGTKVVIIDDFPQGYTGPNKDSVAVILDRPNTVGTTQWKQAAPDLYGRFQDIKNDSVWARMQVSDPRNEKLADQIVASIRLIK